VTDRRFKDEIYGQFARIGTAIASEKRLEIIDLLAQSPRNVDALARLTQMTVANTSRHLQALKAARLVETDREGTKVIYRLAGPEVLRLWMAIRAVGEARLTEIPEIARRHEIRGGRDLLIDRDAVSDASYFVLDVRPHAEFAAGHLPGATSIPVEALEDGLSRLPRQRRIVVYCRGEYCHSADEAVVLLRSEGFDAVRLEGGWPEWLDEGKPTEVGV
jgi:rhodanese-related sulfurtransferase/DNA-binding transcriptional ArsR family regulator